MTAGHEYDVCAYCGRATVDYLCPHCTFVELERVRAEVLRLEAENANLRDELAKARGVIRAVAARAGVRPASPG